MIFFTRKLPAECAVVAIIYIDKLLEVTRLTFHEGNWRIIVFTALLLSSKVWAEHAVWNEDFGKIFTENWLTISEIYRIEREFLKYLSFDLSIKPSAYSRYYFELRSYMNYTGDLPFKPLDKGLAEKLAAKARKKYHNESDTVQRSNSLASYFKQKSNKNNTVSFGQYKFTILKE